jgi:hypothetical protein
MARLAIKDTSQGQKSQSHVPVANRKSTTMPLGDPKTWRTFVISAQPVFYELNSTVKENCGGC